MMKTGDLHLMKQINKTIVLDTIIKKSPVSRAQISELTGLNKSTVSTLVGELIEGHLIREIGPGTSSGGRKPLLLLFNNQAGYAVGIDLGVNYVLAVLTDLQGNIVYERQWTLEDIGPEAVIERLHLAAAAMTAAAPPSPYGIVGIAVGVPGIVDGQGTVLFAPNLRWRQVALAERLGRHFDCPVMVCNEANAGAVGEKEFGAGHGIADMIYVSVGIGIGTGIILNHQLHLGASGFAGEMGHFSVEAAGKLCSCGNRGCWELYASEKALLDQARTLPAFRAANGQTAADRPLAFTPAQTPPSPPADLSALSQLAAAGDEDVLRLLRQVGGYLAVGVVNMINMFNPQLIVIGNRFSGLEPWLGAPLRETVERRSLPYHRKDLCLAFSALGHRSAALGAAIMAISGFFAGSKVSVS